MITLYELAGRDPDIRFSPYCWRTRMALAHKGLDAASEAWRFHEKSSLPGAPENTRVPVLVDGNRIVAGSGDIAFYLEDRYGNGPSLFGGPGGETHARFILAWADGILLPALGPIVAPSVLNLLHPADQTYFRSTREERFGATLEDLAATREERIPAVRALLTPLRLVLAQQPFIGGDEPSYADYCVFGCFQWARCVAAPALLEPEDRLSPWLEEMLEMFDGLAGRAKIAEPALQA